MGHIKDRRPGIFQLALSLLKTNPKWSLARCMAEAKAKWTNKQSKGKP